MNFGGVEENVVTREEFPLSKAQETLKNETIAVIGYGVQGPGQSLNLRDQVHVERADHDHTRRGGLDGGFDFAFHEMAWVLFGRCGFRSRDSFLDCGGKRSATPLWEKA